MSNTGRCAMAAFAFCLLTRAITFSHAFAAENCENLPTSKLQVFSAKAPDLNEQHMPAGQLNRDIPAGVVASRHPMMIVASDVVSWFDISHRVIPRDDGSVCDSPELVRMSFGSNRHTAYLAQAAADDICVRRKMLDHAAVHVRAFDTAVERFIDLQTLNFQRGMQALKRTPAPSADVATARWKEGLRMMLTRSREQLLVDLQMASDNVDDPPALARLKDGCEGRVRDPERRGAADP